MSITPGQSKTTAKKSVPGPKPLHENVPVTREAARPGDVWAWREGRRVYVACPKHSALAGRLKDMGLRFDWDVRARW